MQTLMVRARQDMLVDTSTFPAVALAELRGISAELKAQEAAAATFHQHQVPATAISEPSLCFTMITRRFSYCA